MTEDFDRFQTMSIMSSGPCVVDGGHFQKRTLDIQRETNRTDDIFGAKPTRVPDYTKPDFHNVSDIPKSGPPPSKGFIRHVNVTNDIPKTSPNIQRLDTNRYVNPMNPAYILPSHAPIHQVQNLIDFLSTDEFMSRRNPSS